MVVDCVDILDHALVLAEVTHNPLRIHIGVLYAQKEVCYMKWDWDSR